MQELVRLQRESDSQSVLDVLSRDGAVIVEGLLAPSAVDAIVREATPFLGRASPCQEDFGGLRTVRTGALVARCPSCRPIVLHPLALAIAGGLLGRWCEHFQLHLTQFIEILPEETPQPLHRDRLVFGRHLPREVEPQLNTLWALTDFTQGNGATRVIPGSQHGDWSQEPDATGCVQATMPRGSVLIYTGSVVHGGGPNPSDAARLGMNLTYSLAWLRQEENQYLSCPPEIARTLPAELQKLLGYTTANFALGYWSSPDSRPSPGFDLRDPEQALGQPKRAGAFGSEERVRGGDRF